MNYYIKGKEGDNVSSLYRCLGIMNVLLWGFEEAPPSIHVFFLLFLQLPYIVHH